jgi:hypothetical protein
MFSGSSVSKKGWTRKPKRAKSEKGKANSHAPGVKHPNPDDDLPHLHPHCYEGRFLARLLRREAKSPNLQKLTAEQREQVKLVEKDLKQYSLPSIPNFGGEQTIKDFFATWLSIFDTLFFFDTLPNKVALRLESDPDVEDYHGFWGAEGDVYNIVFNPETRENRGPEGWNNFLSKILHESLHAFLQIYSCQCTRCFDKGWTQASSSSHNSVYANAMIAIQDSLSEGMG